MENIRIKFKDGNEIEYPSEEVEAIIFKSPVKMEDVIAGKPLPYVESVPTEEVPESATTVVLGMDEPEPAHPAVEEAIADASEVPQEAIENPTEGEFLIDDADVPEEVVDTVIEDNPEEVVTVDEPVVEVSSVIDDIVDMVTSDEPIQEEVPLATPQEEPASVGEAPVEVKEEPKKEETIDTGFIGA